MQEMVLHDVAQAADAVVERAAPLDAERLRHRHLHALHVVTVPDRLEQGVREPEHHQVLNGLLAEEVVDPVDRVLGEMPVEQGVELHRAGEVAAERLLEHDPPAALDIDSREPRGDVVEERRRDGEVADGMFGRAQGAAQSLVGGGIAVIAPDVAQARAQALDDAGLDALGHRRAHLGAQPRVVPVAGRDADHGHVQRACGLEAGKRCVQLLVRQVAGDAEEDERVASHDGGVCSTWPPNCLRSADSSLSA